MVSTGCVVGVRHNLESLYMKKVKYQNMLKSDYFMESGNEAERLDVKTDRAAVVEQAKWAGATSGKRVADLGCGAGVTTSILNDCTGPNGKILGLDISPERIAYAETHNAAPRIDYVVGDIRTPLTAHGTFDVLFVRFVLEYYRHEAEAIVRNIYESLAPGGTICLMDLDYNCLSHYGIDAEIETELRGLIETLERSFDFDPYVGRKLYSFLYDLGCEDIEVKMSAHHLIYGGLDPADRFNWRCKVEAAKPLMASEAAHQAFQEGFLRFFEDPRRFTYTPLIMCKGKKPMTPADARTGMKSDSADGL